MGSALLKSQGPQTFNRQESVRVRLEKVVVKLLGRGELALGMQFQGSREGVL